MPFLRTRLFHPLEEPADSALRSPGGQRIEATTLGAAVAVASQLLSIRIVPHDPPKWFRVYGSPDCTAEYKLVDIHVYRGREMICPKQDLSFRLLESDLVSIGVLAC